MIATINPALELFFFLCFHSIPHLGLAPLVVGAIIMAGAAIATAGTSAAIGAIPTKTEKEIKAQKEALAKEIAKVPGLTAAEQEEFSAMGTAAVAGAERELYSRATELAARQQKQEEYRALQSAALQSELARKGAVIQGVQQGGQAASDFATMATLYEAKYGQGGGAVPESVAGGGE